MKVCSVDPDIEAELVEHPPCNPPPLGFRQAKAARLIAENDVFPNLDQRDQREFLRHEFDPDTPRLAGMNFAVPGAGQRDGSAVRPFEAGQETDQRGFAAAIWTDQPMHRSRRDIQRHALQRPGLAEGFCDVSYLDGNRHQDVSNYLFV